MTFSWIETKKELYHMQSLIKNKLRNFKYNQHLLSKLKLKKEIIIMIISHLKTQTVRASSKYQKILILTLIKLKVIKAKVFVLIFKNMKLMKTIF